MVNNRYPHVLGQGAEESIFLRQIFSNSTDCTLQNKKFDSKSGTFPLQQILQYIPAAKIKNVLNYPSMSITIPPNIRNHFERKVQNHEWLASCHIDENIDAFPHELSDSGKGTVLGRSYYPEYPPQLSPIGSDQSCYLINIPLAHSFNSQDTQKFKKNLTLLKEQAFGKSAAASTQEVSKRLGVVIGINQVRSIDSEINRNFKEYIQKLPVVENIAYRTFGFLWKPHWIPKQEQVYGPKKSFLLLKALNPKIAKIIRENLEGSTSISSEICEQIPFQDIRERIKQSTNTKELLLHFTKTSTQAPIYFGPMDADFLQLRLSQLGLLSRYDDLIAQYDMPSVMTLGYSVSEGERPLIRLGVKIDMVVREAMNQIIPGSCYFPEPSSLVLIRKPGKKSILEKLSFSSGGKTLENRRLITSAQRSLDLQKMIFIADGGVVTATPSRMKTEKNGKVTKLTSSVLKQKKNLQTLRAISQTHAMPKQWADNIYPILPIKASQVTDVTTPMMYIFTVFDPISLAFGIDSEVRYSARSFDDAMDHYDDYVKVILGKQKLDAYPKLKKNLVVAGSARLQTQKETLRELGLEEEWIDQIVAAASASGKAIHKVLKSAVP